MVQAVRCKPAPAFYNQNIVLCARRYTSSNSALESQMLPPLIIPALAELQVLLPSKIPSIAQEQQDAVLVHGDFKVDNLIYGSFGSFLLSFALLNV
jgi:hypothetical protein